MYKTLQMIHTSVNIESKALPAATGGGLVLEGITTAQRHAETAATVLHSVNDKKTCYESLLRWCMSSSYLPTSVTRLHFMDCVQICRVGDFCAFDVIRFV